MKRRKMKNVLIVVTILIVSVIILAAFLLRFGISDIEISSQGMSSNEKGQQTEPLQKPIDLGSGLKLTKLSEVTGNFPEDGSDEYVESMLSATFLNEGDKAIQYASVKVTVGEETYSFEFSTLPEEKTVRVFEANKKNLTGVPGAILAEIETIAYFQEEPSIYENDLEITISDGVICVKNISEKDINKEISVFYKTVSGDTLIGGITYRFRVPAGLAAGEEYKGIAMHASDKASKVLFITYGE